MLYIGKLVHIITYNRGVGAVPPRGQLTIYFTGKHFKRGNVVYVQVTDV